MLTLHTLQRNECHTTVAVKFYHQPTVKSQDFHTPCFFCYLRHLFISLLFFFLGLLPSLLHRVCASTRLHACECIKHLCPHVYHRYPQALRAYDRTTSPCWRVLQAAAAVLSCLLLLSTMLPFVPSPLFDASSVPIIAGVAIASSLIVVAARHLHPSPPF